MLPWHIDEPGPHINGLPVHCKCDFCGVWHEQVEAGGMWYCPNPTCCGCGAAPHRRDMPSFERLDEGRHTVLPSDVLDVAYKRLETEKDEELRKAILVGIEYWKGDLGAFRRHRGGANWVQLPARGDPMAAARTRIARVAQELMDEGAGDT